MKAAVMREAHQPLVIEDVHIDDPGPRAVLIKTSACGVCHSDLHFVEGLYPTKMPIVLGHEAAGVVEKVGSLVDYVKPGDHVITSFSRRLSQQACVSGSLLITFRNRLLIGSEGNFNRCLGTRTAFAFQTGS